MALLFQHHNPTTRPPTTITYGVHPTPFGPSFIASTGDHTICRFEFLKHSDLASAQSRLRQAWPQTTITQNDAATETAFNQLWQSWQGQQSLPITLLVSGTPLQRNVWQALTAIPYGTTTSYSTLAQQANYPQAIRAVASAIGANPISLLVPCHRVIRKDGSLGGFAWGLDVKQAILETEQSQHVA